MTTPLNNKKGTTLVELMVCLVLLALFGTAAVTLVKPCAEAYIEVQQLTRAQNLADALTETIRGELADADGTISIVNAATESDADSADADSANNIFIEDARLTEGTALRFTVESSYTEILDAGYVPKLTATTLNADKKLDEGRLQFKLAAAEARDAAGKRPSARETMAAIRAKAAEASEAARRASEDARLNAAEAANAARLAAKGTAERAAELLQLEQLAAELQQRSEEMQTQLLRTPRIVGPRRMLRAYPKLRHGSKLRSLPTLREMLRRAEQENKDDNKNTK